VLYWGVHGPRRVGDAERRSLFSETRRLTIRQRQSPEVDLPPIEWR